MISTLPPPPTKSTNSDQWLGKNDTFFIDIKEKKKKGRREGGKERGRRGRKKEQKKEWRQTKKVM